jgi:DNA-binding CsgD family transcriptional regulator
MPRHLRPRLRGRRSERETLDRLLESVRAGQSRVLVLRGEEGVGKSALLAYLLERAGGCRIARVVGVESELELAFAGLHQLCAPWLDRLERLPGPQRDALGTAFGLSAGDAPDRFLVGLAVLGLLSDAAAERPVVCVVDDVQWLDRASAQTLAFVARRLLAESVAMVFAVREPGAGQELSGFPEIVLGGLSNADARALLDTAIPGRLDEQVRNRIVAETRGNPLALLELPRDLTPAELAGGFGLPAARPLAGRIEESFLRRLRSLPPETQRLLVTAAAEPIGDAALLWRAAGRLGIGTDAAAPATAEGLVEIGADVRFRHPLVRTAAYRAASPGERRAAHRALAEATDPAVDPDRRAWHLARATSGPDEGIAEELERSAGRAQGRGGIAAAAAFLERAAELTPDPARRGARALAAAQAVHQAGAPDAAMQLLASAELGPLSGVHGARAEVLRARIAFASSRGGDAPPLLLDAARRLTALEPRLARETYLEALGATIFAGRLSGDPGAREAAQAALAAPPAPPPPRALDLLLDGVATRFTEAPGLSVPPLRQALRAFLQEVRGRGRNDIPWLWLACPVAPEPIALELWDDARWEELATRAVALARETGALAVLPIALSYRACMHVHAGEFDAASALLSEADAIAVATGDAPLRYTQLVLVALRGSEAKAMEQIEADVQDATARGEGRAIGLARYATALLNNGLGRYETALDAAARACEYEDLGFIGWALTELVEAAARSERPDVAAAALRRLEEATLASGTDWALGTLARSRALLSDGPAAEEGYREAIERLARSRVAVHRARAHLVYGEWLRRESRRLDAREQLRVAHEMLARFGAEAFAERARRELVATGQSVRRRAVETRDELTAQELQIARLAAGGRTNPQIGAELFLSPRTVEWHLRNVFAKLRIRSRRELREALDGPEGRAPAA